MTPTTALGQGAIAAMWAGLYPEMAAKIEAGGCYVEFGCGIGGALLSTLLLYPRATAIGFEINAQVIAETRRLAAELGVADRLTMRHMDVRDVTEEAAYDTAFWSQGFFPEESRQAALAAIFRAMKPGGYLGIPGFEGGEPPTPEERSGLYGRAYALNRLIYAQWGIPAPAADELCAMVEAAGFECIRMIPFGAWKSMSSAARPHEAIRRPLAPAPWSPFGPTVPQRDRRGARWPSLSVTGTWYRRMRCGPARTTGRTSGVVGRLIRDSTHPLEGDYRAPLCDSRDVWRDALDGFHAFTDRHAADATSVGRWWQD